MAEKPEPIRPTKTGRYRSVVEMVRDLSDDEEFTAQFEKDVNGRALIRLMTAIRSARGLSQQDVAQALNCSQSRVSKMESGADADLRFGDIQAYARVIGLEVAVELRQPGMTLVDQIKRDTLATRDALHHLAGLARGDTSIVDGLRGFMMELLANTSLTVAQIEQRFTTYAQGFPPEKVPTVSYHGDAAPLQKALPAAKLSPA